MPVQYIPKYSYLLVSVSIAVAILASFVAIELANIARNNQNGKFINRWLGFSALALGLGIWTMHFIGMFAFKLPIPVFYDATLTLVSLVIAIAASFLGFLTAHKRHHFRHIVLGGSIMGLGIVGMHYTGMMAMRLNADMVYNVVLVSISVFIAIAAAIIALWLLTNLQAGKRLETTNQKLLIATTLGLAIAGMHYTGMAAATIISVSNTHIELKGFMIEGEVMVTALSSAAILLILFPMYSVRTERRISARLAAEIKLLHINEAHLRALIENVPDAFFVHDEQGNFLDVNKVTCRELGYTREEMLTKTVFDIEAKVDKNRLTQVVWPELINEAGQTLYGIHVRKDGSRFPVEINITGIVENNKKYIFGLARDITESEKLKRTLSKLAMTDDLTNINNRRAFIHSLDREISRAKRKNEALSLLMIDIDYFKKINDTYGHHTGDKALQHFVKQTKNIIRIEDIFGRLGGEEFSILLPNTGLQMAEVFAERLKKTIQDSSFMHDNKKIQFTISIGIASYDNKKMSTQILLNNADQALYNAKGSGRNRVMLYEKSI